ncbi:hypothetical protein B9Z55_003124 [Caenorhabditis nigoni]|nr:hypothetical protein B9Z55_003124 [Caenorhabditis nigoni]
MGTHSHMDSCQEEWIHASAVSTSKEDGAEKLQKCLMTSRDSNSAPPHTRALDYRTTPARTERRSQAVWRRRTTKIQEKFRKFGSKRMEGSKKQVPSSEKVREGLCAKQLCWKESQQNQQTQGDAKETGHTLPWMVRIPVQVKLEAPSYLDEHERPAGVRGSADRVFRPATTLFHVPAQDVDKEAAVPSATPTSYLGTSQNKEAYVLPRDDTKQGGLRPSYRTSQNKLAIRLGNLVKQHNDSQLNFSEQVINSHFLAANKGAKNIYRSVQTVTDKKLADDNVENLKIVEPTC